MDDGDDVDDGDDGDDGNHHRLASMLSEYPGPKLWLGSSQTSMIHVCDVSMREHPKNEDFFESVTENVSLCTI